MFSHKNSVSDKVEEVLMNDLMFDQTREILDYLHNHKDIEHVLKARDIIWTTNKMLKDLINDRVEKSDSNDYRTLTDIEQTLIYMIDHELCNGDEYTAEVLQDLKDKYW